MTTMTFKHNVQAGRDGLTIRSAVATVWRLIAYEWSVRMANRTLSRLDDAALDDIGISRAEIDDAVRYGRPSRTFRKRD